jgi:hypothetical protein
MVTSKERRFIRAMVAMKAFKAVGGFFGTTEIWPRYGFGWILEAIKRRQVVDDLHHAPCCPANHFHKCRLVFETCTCGAVSLEVTP